MSKPSRHGPLTERVRRLVEEYTPDGTVGRLLLASVVGTGAGVVSFLTLGFITYPILASLLVVPLGAVASLALWMITVLTLWPVYLWAIGRTESPTAYSRKLRGQSDAPSTERLKRAYQRGDLSEDELERELDGLLDGTEPERSDQQLEDPEHN